MTKEDLRAELGDYINRFHKRRDYMGLHDALHELDLDLNELFDGKDAITAFIHSVEPLPDGRFRLEVDSFEAAADKEEWLACFQDYVGDRFVVEPYEPPRLVETSIALSMEDIADESLMPSFLVEYAEPKKNLFVNFAGHSYPVEMLLDEPASGMVKIGATIPIDEPGIGDRLFSALKKYSVPASTENGDNDD